MLIHPWDRASRDEWQDILRHVDFGQLVAGGTDGYPVVVPAHFVYDGDGEIWLHLARPNPIWPALEADPRAVFVVTADHSYIEAAWNADDDVPPEHGVPTSYYTSVQLRGTARIVDDEDGKSEILRAQLRRLEPADSTREPPSPAIESDRRQLPGIRGVRLSVESVLAKMKYGGNRSLDKRSEIAAQLATRDAPGDAAARAHLVRRSRSESADTMRAADRRPPG
jgi:transcriptional regulator